ncbi:hypothetical protein Tco_1069779 [Tanacetum coccineum]|uniref:Uncharacterized protein n=1 Tax=Tanacetum coccineum TaxID=301880 RepID=A0ABQ5HLG8_9ASTR
MSSPDHPTANLEDAFSSNFPNYVPAGFRDYVPAIRETYSCAFKFIWKLMPPKRASTTEEPAMTQDAIRKLVADSVTSALEA